MGWKEDKIKRLEIIIAYLEHRVFDLEKTLDFWTKKEE